MQADIMAGQYQFARKAVGQLGALHAGRQAVAVCVHGVFPRQGPHFAVIRHRRAQVRPARVRAGVYGRQHLVKAAAVVVRKSRAVRRRSQDVTGALK